MRNGDHMKVASRIADGVISIFSRVLLLAAVITAWWLLARFHIIDAAILPPPAHILATFKELAVEGNLAAHVKISLYRVLKGFLIGGSLGFVLGVLMGLSSLAEKVIGPTFHAVRQVPILGWMPLIVLWCGVGETAKVVFITIGAVYPMTLNTFEGVRSISREYLEVGDVFELNRFQQVKKIILPAALPNILTGVRFSLNIAWMLVVGAEIFSVSAGGLGDMIWSARDTFRMDIVIVGLIIITLIGIVFNKTLEQLGDHLLQWRRVSH